MGFPPEPESTALKAVFGLIEMGSGDIFFEGRSIKFLRPDQRAAEGISLRPEGRRLFPSMTVIENLAMGAFFRKEKDTKSEMERILGLLPSLKEKIRQKAASFPPVNSSCFP